MTTKQAAGLLNMTQRRIYQLIRDGYLTAKKPGGRDWDVDEESVNRELERRRRGKDEGKTSEEV